ncbi:type I phosphomannose isomerase catalytic subunit [Butyrivibrio sp. INlla16]|uniref:type I phosphomannose isomerase catalytic subunit n=1 Tax=Butyrivibrio sp. INlla16 TaxID=1520807 RepID=UPI000883F301|nr:type I phosphomannose isomerase catalytic subunit [Butyrivibrio sp. INlla16]SDB27483.1 mannose-6-phosphate isomerase [Butyrivibrio sp. INlla16]
MSLLKLKATTKDYLWGGNKLVQDFGKTPAGEVTAESWELSCYPGSESVIENGEFANKTIIEYIEKNGRGVLGSKCEQFKDFPVLIKFIDAKKDLSLQVHPSDEYAKEHENQYGKTEMWYIIDAEKDAFLYYGFNREIKKEEFAARIENQTLTEVLNAYPVKKGDVIFIESGTLHAIGAGILLAEIQQNSNVTYRVYDYGRRDKNGNLRELHVEKAMDVTTLAPVAEVKPNNGHIASCKYFTVDKVVISQKDDTKFCGNVGKDSFLHVLIVDGSGVIRCENEEMVYKKGDSFFLPAGSGNYEIEGCCEALLTYEE